MMSPVLSLGLALVGAGPSLPSSAAASNAARVSAPLAACYAPGTADDYIAEIERRSADLGLELSLRLPRDSFQFSDTSRWNQTASDACCLRQGDPTTLTWSIVPDGTTIVRSGSIASEATGPSNLVAWLDGLYGSASVWLPIVQGVFDRWGAITGIDYVYEPSDDGAQAGASSPAGMLGVRGDVRIAGHRLDGNANVLAYNYFPTNGDMIIDTGDNTFSDKANGSRKLRNTIAHEHGHGLGMNHVCPINETKLMEPFLSTRFDGPQFDDLLGSNRGYGDRDEPDDNTAAAVALGSIAPESFRTRTEISIDDEGDYDFYSFTVGTGSKATVTITPKGTTYLSGPQSSSPCGPGSSFNALNQQDLGVALIDRNATTLIASTDARAAGQVETLTDISLASGAGTYYLQVYGKTRDRAQIYDLSVAVSGPPVSSPTLYESADPASIVLPANAVGSGTASPFDHAGAAGPLWFYQLDDGTGNPPRIQLVKGGSGLLVHFP